MTLITTANGTPLFHNLRGPETAPVVVFSNSIGTTLEMWDAQADALSTRFRVLRYDTRGHGRSPVLDRPAPSSTTIEDLADDLAGLLDVLGIQRAHVVGLSLGGMTAQMLAVRRPDLVDHLVLMATAAHLPGDWPDRAALVQARGMAAIVDAVVTRWFTPAFRDDPAVAALKDRFTAMDPAGYAACCLAIGAMDLRPLIPAVTAPTLVVMGADDPATPPAMGETIRALIPGAELAVLPRAAHILAMEQAARVNQVLLDFLGESRGGTPFEAGLANRRAVLGAAHVDRSLAAAGAFAGPWQDFITRMAWGEIWGDPTIPWKTRSMLTLALMVALGREEEFKLHVRPALRNGVTLPELRALLKQCAVYAGVPAANAAFRMVREVLGAEADEA